MKIAISGASGFVGSHVKRSFSDFVLIDRSDSHEEILKKLHGVDVVINLAGAPIIKRWSNEYKKILLSSRIDSTKKVVNAINESEVKHFISTSAIGVYPDNGAYDESFDGYGDDFLAHLTKEWESEAKKCTKLVSIVRFGVILGADGGALAQMIPPFSLGFGGVIGDGEAMMSWIDVDDLMGIYAFIIDKELGGIFNAVSPNPVTNYEFTKTLGAVLKKPTIIPLPIFVLKLLFGEGSTVLSGSKEIYPKALLDAGFEFKYANLKPSLKHLLDK